MKSDKFKTLANARVNKVIKLMRLIGNLANKSHYEYTNKQSKQITDALQSELNLIKTKFRNPKGGRSQSEFTLD
tara:strand:- start:395 stop:616 length:222 start_codon:yes stop_codon:yes gene_type:complete